MITRSHQQTKCTKCIFEAAEVGEPGQLEVGLFHTVIPNIVDIHHHQTRFTEFAIGK